MGGLQRDEGMRSQEKGRVWNRRDLKSKMTIYKLYRDVSSMKKKAPIPSCSESKERESESQVWMNDHRGEQNETN